MERLKLRLLSNLMLQLSSEDYRWWWRSVFSAGSTGIFVFLYSCFYYLRRSNMSGSVETVSLNFVIFD